MFLVKCTWKNTLTSPFHCIAKPCLHPMKCLHITISLSDSTDRIWVLDWDSRQRCDTTTFHGPWLSFSVNCQHKGWHWQLLTAPSLPQLWKKPNVF
jgi:hypothetical protein